MQLIPEQEKDDRYEGMMAFLKNYSTLNPRPEVPALATWLLSEFKKIAAEERAIAADEAARDQCKM